jgi:hypothetical protein
MTAKSDFNAVRERCPHLKGNPLDPAWSFIAIGCVTEKVLYI